MKFSYTLIKKLVPALKNKKDLVEKLNEFSFEAVNFGNNVFDVSVPPNRFSDAASHWGIAREISAILGRNLLIPGSGLKIKSGKAKAPFKVEIQDKNLCSRYMARYFENVKVAASPKWLQNILIDCGLRPINSVVDIMNYAMLETGQPLHAFDFDKLAANNQQLKTIIVRRAKKGEKITTLDNKNFELNENILVIADYKNPLAIAGVKGGKSAEVDKNTKRIVVESANFNGVSIYKTSKILKLSTDASLRFSHNISPELAALGINRAGQLLEEIAKAEAGAVVDVNFSKPIKKIIKFDSERFKKFIGLDLDAKTCRDYFERLGFAIKIPAPKSYPVDQFLVEAPLSRQDIEVFEDLAEEIIRLYGYNKLKSSAPHIHLHPSGFEDQIVLKDKIRKALASIGLDEVSNYSFIGENDPSHVSGQKEKLIELENPISVQFKYLRPSLADNLIKNINANFRFFEEIKIFEIGKIFFKTEQEKLKEKLALGIVLASKKNKELFFEMKGIIEQLFGKIGLVSYLMPEFSSPYDYFISGEVLKIESDGLILGYFGRLDKKFTGGAEAVLGELDLETLLKLVEEEQEYRPLTKYPSVMRDISILVDSKARVGEIMQAIQESDFKYIEDVDLIDEYEINNTLPQASGKERSLTLRIVFQAEDRTLTDREVNAEMNKINKLLESKFKAKIR